MSKNVLNEVNTIREQMGLPLLNENELLHLELSKIDLDPLNEGWWENAKYALSKLGRYKAGGKIFGKTQTDAKANAQIMAWITDEYSKMVGKNTPGVVTGKPLEIGGSLGRDTATAQGGFYSFENISHKIGLKKEEVSIAVNGFGLSFTFDISVPPPFLTSPLTSDFIYVAFISFLGSSPFDL